MNEICGLLSSVSGPIPLMGMRVKGDILGRGAKVKISQRFMNQEDKAIEAVYKFPLPEGAAVCGFRAAIDGKKIQGQVEERDRAFEMYDDALSRGDGGYLLDEERPNIFTLSVGNLNPNAEVMVEIEYVILLDMEGRQVRFFLPTTISPRYIPDGMDENDGIPEDGKIHPLYSESVPYGLSLSLNIHKGNLLESINSPSHPIRVKNLKGDPINITFSTQSVKMDRDFILNMEYEESLACRAYRYRSGEESFIQLDLLFETEQFEATDSRSHNAQKLSKQIIFVLDCSGSMTGDSIREAKKALEICLRGLDPENSFSIYRFGSDYECLFKKPEKYSEASLEKGLEYLKNIDADLGGTEILSPLKDIYSVPLHNGSLERTVVLITDGEVGNEEQVFELVSINQYSTRVFSIGIGAGCNEYFIKGLARAGGGASEFIYPGERIEPKVLRLFSKITQKGITDVSIQWGKESIEQAPMNPAIFFESPMTLFARYKDQNFHAEKITIKGYVNGEYRQWEINVTESHDENVPVPILWARERIRDLEEMKGGLEERGSRRTERKADPWKEIIFNLSKKYGILSRSTSFVAIEEREEKDKITGELVLRKIPVPVTMGWHGLGSVFGVREADVKYDMISPLTMVQETSALYEFASESTDREYDHKTGIILDILSVQKAEGGMEINDRVSLALGIDSKQLMKITSDIKVEIEVDKYLLLSTAILLQVLEIHFSYERKTWARIIEKSRNWMMDVLHEGRPKVHGKDLMSWAEEFVRNNVWV